MFAFLHRFPFLTEADAYHSSGITGDTYWWPTAVHGYCCQLTFDPWSLYVRSLRVLTFVPMMKSEHGRMKMPSASERGGRLNL